MKRKVSSDHLDMVVKLGEAHKVASVMSIVGDAYRQIRAEQELGRHAKLLAIHREETRQQAPVAQVALPGLVVDRAPERAAGRAEPRRFQAVARIHISNAIGDDGEGRAKSVEIQVRIVGERLEERDDGDSGTLVVARSPQQSVSATNTSDNNILCWSAMMCGS